jgi:hypothetical protein
MRRHPQSRFNVLNQFPVNCHLLTHALMIASRTSPKHSTTKIPASTHTATNLA